MSAPSPLPPLRFDLAELLDQVAERQRADFGHMASDFKADGTLITACDRWSDQTLVEGLARLYPGEGVLSEEGLQTVPKTPAYWVVDPLDGTTNFAAGIPYWAISMARFEQGRPVLAILDVPPLRQRIVDRALESAEKAGDAHEAKNGEARQRDGQPDRNGGRDIDLHGAEPELGRDVRAEGLRGHERPSPDRLHLQPTRALLAEERDAPGCPQSDAHQDRRTREDEAEDAGRQVASRQGNEHEPGPHLEQRSGRGRCPAPDRSGDQHQSANGRERGHDVESCDEDRADDDAARHPRPCGSVAHASTTPCDQKDDEDG